MLPCYNPPHGWEKQVVKSFKYIKEAIPDTKISLTIVNDGSNQALDKAIRYIQQETKSLQYIHHIKNSGKGHAVRSGASAISTDYLIYTDIDFPYLDSDIIAFFHLLATSETDLVIGVRPNNYYDNIPFLRKKISLWYKALLRRFLRIPTTDTQAGLKGLSVNAKNQLIECETDGYLFDLELIKRCSKALLVIEQKEITLKPNIIMRKMPIKILLEELLNFLKIARL